MSFLNKKKYGNNITGANKNKFAKYCVQVGELEHAIFSKFEFVNELVKNVCFSRYLFKIFQRPKL